MFQHWNMGTVSLEMNVNMYPGTTSRKGFTMAENSYENYQLKRNEHTRRFSFEGTDYLKKIGEKVNRDHYDMVYHAPLDTKETLDSIYEKFNLRHPADFRGHSLSVSDVIVFHTDGTDTGQNIS